jgi:hypothetical protein
MSQARNEANPRKSARIIGDSDHSASDYCGTRVDTSSSASLRAMGTLSIFSDNRSLVWHAPDFHVP